MSAITQTLVTEIATKLNARNSPPVKDGIAYRIIVFKAKHPEKWVVAMIPDLFMIDELFIILNESYAQFLEGEHTPCGIVFLCSDHSEELVDLAGCWYYDSATSIVRMLN